MWNAVESRTNTDFRARTIHVFVRDTRTYYRVSALVATNCKETNAISFVTTPRFSNQVQLCLECELEIRNGSARGETAGVVERVELVGRLQVPRVRHRVFVYAMTTPDIGKEDAAIEYNSAKTIANVAVEKGAEYIIFSTLPAPDKFEGKTLLAAQGLYSFEDVAAIMARTTGKKVVYKQVTLDEYKQSISLLPPPVVEFCIEGMLFGDEYAYFGPEEEERIGWSVENVKEKLLTFEEFLEKHPLKLE
ncbi:hypothetical protein K504DRAFT_537063 [Pleomassaria siparia CBS 279.74]|uniref:NmrA-like domain-containing protein n=1 Tax=Pleomassaria siparia CBS 279.74 TaxID=1314801 RepID=A0A6G1JZ35_9PLEO|nr:hypothetical protein K504DRAFT_537063 [Pleomassaria siparia CBS 279.74]